MIRFKFIADCEFNAENIDDACNKLAEHFHFLTISRESNLLTRGSMQIEPIPEIDK